MSKFFIKDFYWLFIHGKDGIELYNVKNGSKFIYLNSDEAKIFIELYHGKDIDSFEKTEIFNNVLDIIKNNGIGEFKDKFYISPEYKKGKDGIGFFEKPAKLTRTFIEIPSKCNKCENCDKIFSAPCFLCHKTKDVDIKVSIDDYIKIIDGIKDNDCQEVLLHGADILSEKLTYLLWDYVIEKEMILSVIIHNNMLNEESIAKIRNKYNNNVRIVVNFDIMNNEEKENVCNKIDETVKLLGLDKNAIHVSLKIDSSICKEIKQIKKEIYDRGFLIRNVSIVSNKQITEDELHQIYLLDEYRYEIAKALKQNNLCMTGTLSFDTELNILCCPHMRDYIIKDKEGNLNAENMIRALWTLTKDKFEQCSTCSKRLRCLDCRAVESNYTGSMVGKRECMYYSKNVNE